MRQNRGPVPPPQRLIVGISGASGVVYGARLMDAAEARALHLVNEIVPRDAVLERAIAIAEQVSAYNPDILRLGRDLYYNMRGLGPAQTRLAMLELVEPLLERRG